MKKILITIFATFALAGVSHAGSFGVGVSGGIIQVDGSGTETNRFVGGDDYRSQKFPNGSNATISTYNFKINRE